MIEIQCFGPPVVTVDGSEPPAELLWRKHLALLVYLSRSPKPRTRDHLIGLLWPDKEEAKARHSLNEALRVIRRIAQGALVTEGDNVVLDRSAVKLDTDDPMLFVAGGVFLEGFSVPDAPAFEDWMSGERERLRVLSLDGLVESAERSLAVGSVSAGRDAALKALEIEPLHEPAARVLMRAHALEGGRVLALQVYGRLADLLKRDVGLEPGQETKELAARIRSERIVRGAPARDATPHDVVPIVGAARDALAVGIEVWSSARGGKPAMLVVRGDPGTGKTRVADELAARARLDGAVVAYTRPLENEAIKGIWSALLKGGLLVAELGGAAPQVLAALGELEPDIFVRFPAAKEQEPTPGAGDPLLQAVLAIAEARPVLLVLDDAHRADASSYEALGAIVQRAGNAPLCALLTASAGPAAAALDSVCQRVGRDIPGCLVGTESFGDSDVEELISWAFPEYDEDSVARLRRRVLADTAGNPFLAVELIRAVRAGLRLREESSPVVWPAESRTLEETIPGELPETVAAAFRVRFRALTEAAQAMLTAVAVLGGSELTSVLARAADLSVEEADRALDELEWQRWLVGDARGYSFVARLAREVLLADMITGGQKRRVRERAEGGTPT